VIDEPATQLARQAAMEAIDPVLVRDRSLEDVAFEEVAAIIGAVQTATTPLGAALPSIPNTTSTTSSTTTTTIPVDQNAEPAVAQEIEEVPVGVIEGTVFIDVDADGVLNAEEPVEGRQIADRPWQDVEVVAVSADGAQFRGTTDRNGAFSIEVPYGSYDVLPDTEAGSFPEGFVPSGEADFEQQIDCQAEVCEAAPLSLTARFAPTDSIVDQVQGTNALLAGEYWTELVQYAQEDVYRNLFSMGDLLSSQIETEATDRLQGLFQFEVPPEGVQAARTEALNDRRSVTIDNVADADARELVNRLVSVTILANMVEDEEQTDLVRQRAAEAVQPEQTTFFEGRPVVEEGDTFSEFTIAAINATNANLDRTVRQAAAGGLLAVLMAVLAYYLARFRRVYWERPRMVTLFGMLIVLSAGAVRLSIAFQESSSWYVLPAVAFGYLAAVLFDNRMGTLMAMALGVVALIGTGEPGVGVYATLATLAPIGFVSSVSTRRAFRNSVAVSAIAGAVIAAACSWFFQAEIGQNPIEQIWRDAAWAGAVALVASLVALAAMPFFESMFDITTTLRLLELTDRNHEALQVLLAKAFGTFNHSLMVGTLADSAAKAIGANNLLARAAAYYHDLGKTENPGYFIENQFGSANPHDQLEPEESARIIRQHVVDGVDLARRFNIPSEVAEGIVSHHGDGIMRYFYEKARQADGDGVDPDLFRHAGHKPQTREMAIIMMSDAVEGACRAIFADEEPKPESIAKVVNRVIDEKVADGQLSESDLTLAELSTVRRAFIDALTGHYHQRIPYPNFPGS
jgi:putative nucleotidyltransferase with HDIG domain